MKQNSFISFVLGLVIGAALLFVIEHTPQIGGISHSPEQAMQTKVSGLWQGSLDVGENSVDFSLVVKNDGKNLSGVLNSTKFGNVPCDQLQVDSLGNISFSGHVKDKAAAFTGKVAPDIQSMTGGISVTGNINGDGDGTWSLSKSKS